MSDVKSLMFSHNHNLLKVRGCKSLPDVLCFEGHEALSEPFKYTIEFTSTDKTITAQQMLMQDASLTLVAPVDQGYGIKCSSRCAPFRAWSLHLSACPPRRMKPAIP
jgi:type VI secretion system secreted protein VgrG